MFLLGIGTLILLLVSACSDPDIAKVVEVTGTVGTHGPIRFSPPYFEFTGSSEIKHPDFHTVYGCATTEAEARRLARAKKYTLINAVVKGRVR